jgi:hypothetical protein
MSVTLPRPVAPVPPRPAELRPAPLPPLAIAPDDPRLAPLAEELAARFGRHCAGMPAEAFARLVRRAAWIRLRWPS